MCFPHVTDAPGSRGAIPVRIVCIVFAGCRIWGLAVPVTGILGKLLTGEVLGLLTPPGGGILVLLQSLAGSRLRAQLGHSGGRQEPTPKPQADTGDWPRATSPWDRAKETRKELPQPLAVGRGFRSLGCGVHLGEGLPQLPEVRARQFGSPGRVSAGIGRVFYPALGRSWELLEDPRVSAARAGSRRK